MQVLTMQAHPSEPLTAEEAFAERIKRLPALSRAIRLAKHALSADSFVPVFEIVSVDKIGQDPSTGSVKRHWPVALWRSRPHGSHMGVMLRFDDRIVRAASSVIVKQRWTTPIDFSTISLDEFDGLIAQLNEMADMPR